MEKPVITACAATGGIHRPTMSPCLITPAEITEAAVGTANVKF